MIDEEPTDDQRYPTLTEVGASMLRFLKEHPSAPIFRNQSGNRLTEHDIAGVVAFEREVSAASVGFEPSPPGWVQDVIAHCYESVPHYREQGTPPKDLRDVPSVNRGDYAKNIPAFVPDEVPVERLINFRTTGTTGHPLLIPSHPAVAAKYLAFHKRAFRRAGITLRHRRGQVGVLLLGYQKKCFTYVSVTPTMDESGLAKINLYPDDWRELHHREAYIDALAPEVIAGDPISYAALLELPTKVKPKALLSTSMSLSAGLRSLLEQRFECPVFDVYSLNEAGPIAVYDSSAGGHVLLQHRMYVEILDDEDQPVPPGQRGEVTLTGGFNFCLPLLRYRTGDYASLERFGDEAVLRGFAGRDPVRFETWQGEVLNNIDVTHALAPLAIAQYALHQDADRSLSFKAQGYFGSPGAVKEALFALFGKQHPMTVDLDAQFDGKARQYTTDHLVALTP